MAPPPARAAARTARHGQPPQARTAGARAWRRTPWCWLALCVVAAAGCAQATPLVRPAGPRAEPPWIGPDLPEDSETARRPPLAVGERAALTAVDEDALLDARHKEDDRHYQRARPLTIDARMSQRCRQHRPAIERGAQMAGVDPMLMLALAWVESGFTVGARSSAGARGLMQMQPATASAMGCRDTSDPACSAEAASRLVAWLLRKYQGEVVYALCAYNAGSAQPTRAWKKGELPFNMGFATRVLEARNRLERHGCDGR